MLIRALIVLLVVLNLGVAGWWISRPAPQPPAPPAQPQGVALLRLADEAPPAAKPAAAAPVETTTPAPASAAKPGDAASARPAETAAVADARPRCFSLGPFADAGAAQAAIAKLQDAALRSHAREAKGIASGSFSVYLPPQPNRAAAQALARRIGEAGFGDILVVGEGDMANGIALGLYHNQEGAQRRLAALQAAGFPAQMRASGEESPSQWWADVAAKPGFDAAQARAKAGAEQAQALDCAALR
jgi:hypothetical protein